MGRLKRSDGIIYNSKLRQTIKFNGKITRIYRVIAENFLPNPENKPCVDHKTHAPRNMNINDVRNLRWCTYKENSNFAECKEKQRKAKLGKTLTEEHKMHIGEARKGKHYV